MILNSEPKKPTYPVVTITVENPKKPGGPYYASLRVPNGEIKPVAFSLTRANLALKEADAESYGLALGKALFSNRVLGVEYQKLLSAASVNQERVHIRLEIKPDALQSLHWERIYHPLDNGWSPLGSSAATPLSRTAPPGVITPLQRVHERPLRLLVIIASPSGLKERFRLDPISAEERQALHLSLDALKNQGVAVTYLESGAALTPTLENLRKIGPQNFHLVHFLCHGAVTDGGSLLYLEGDDGAVESVTTDRLVAAMQLFSPRPLFCFLAACESAARDAHDAFLPLGPALVQIGCVQAAVAMSGKVGIETARVFASQFYTRLLFHGLVDLAVNEARSLVQEHWDWGVPVLFSRIADNQLFDFPQTRFYERSVALNDQAYTSLRQVKDTALEHIQEMGYQTINDIDELIGELNKSHRFLNQTASDFRDLGYDQDSLARNFPPYYPVFKRMVGSQTWVSEKSSCRKIDAYADKIIRVVAPYLEAQNLAALKAELNQLSNSDDDMISLFMDFLGQMDQVIEQIHRRLLQNDLTGALQAKLAFDAQIDPTLRRSIAMFAKMEGNLHKAQAA